MRFAVLLSVSLSLATTSVSNGAEFSQSRDVPPLKVAANELDAILNKTHSFIDAANGPAGQDSSRETVKVRVRGHEIEIPHFSLASNLAFPNEIFAFSYTYYQADKPISSVSIDLGDSPNRSGNCLACLRMIFVAIQSPLVARNSVAWLECSFW
jgi:hypothetical protein